MICQWEYRHTDGVTEIAFYVLSNYWPQKTFRRRYFHLRKRTNRGSEKSSRDLEKYFNWAKSSNSPTLQGTFLFLFLWLLLFCSMHRTNRPHFAVCKWCLIISIPTVSHSTIAEHNTTKYTAVFCSWQVYLTAVCLLANKKVTHENSFVPLKVVTDYSLPVRHP